MHAVLALMGLENRKKGLQTTYSARAPFCTIMDITCTI